jgi:hypothetical protein
MLRRTLLIAAGLTVILAVPTAAQAKWWVKVPKKPKKVHVIAVRRGHHVIWKVKHHGLPTQKLHPVVKLSSDFRSARSIRGFDFNQISTSLGSCPTTPATDGLAYYEPYGGYYGSTSPTTGVFSDTLTCFGGGGPSTAFYAAVTPPIGCSFPNLAGQSIEANAEFVNFVDGEWAVMCNKANDTAGTPGGIAPGFTVSPVLDQSPAFSFVGQAFTCQDTVGVGANGQTPDNIRNQDSIEFYQALGNNTYSITTTCIGNLHHVPGSPTPPSQPTAHWLGCLEYNPFPGASLKGYGVSVTYPDGQYSETCNVPNYKTS